MHQLHAHPAAFPFEKGDDIADVDTAQTALEKLGGGEPGAPVVHRDHDLLDPVLRARTSSPGAWAVFSLGPWLSPGARAHSQQREIRVDRYACAVVFRWTPRAPAPHTRTRRLKNSSSTSRRKTKRVSASPAKANVPMKSATPRPTSRREVKNQRKRDFGHDGESHSHKHAVERGAMAQLVQAQRGQTQQKNHGDEKDARPDLRRGELESRHCRGESLEANVNSEMNREHDDRSLGKR